MFVELKKFPGYLITCTGDIVSLKRNRWKQLKHKITPDGYAYVNLAVDGSQITCRVHRLVIEAFYGPSDMQVNHKNGIKLDNTLENLEYCTPKQNIRHAIEMGLASHGRPQLTITRSYKFSKDLIEEIRALRPTHTIVKLANMFGISPTHVQRICTGQTRTTI